MNTYKLQKARMDTQRAAKKLDQLEGQRDLLLQQKGAAAARKQAAEEQLGIYDKVQILLQKTSDYAKQQARRRIEDIVSQALTVVFGGTQRFIVELKTKANQPVAGYYLDDGQVVTKLEKPDYDRGGGKVDVISLALRLAVGESEGIRGPLFLDEVGKHVSAEYAPNVAYFLKEYSENFGRQIILITHNQALADIGDVSLQVTQTNGESGVAVI